MTREAAAHEAAAREAVTGEVLAAARQGLEGAGFSGGWLEDIRPPSSLSVWCALARVRRPIRPESQTHHEDRQEQHHEQSDR